MFCTVMLRCESRAGLGEPVEPVVGAQGVVDRGSTAGKAGRVEDHSSEALAGRADDRRLAVSLTLTVVNHDEMLARFGVPGSGTAAVPKTFVS